MKRLTWKQKAKNKAAYKIIRKEYDKVKDKAPVSYIQFKHRVNARAKADKMTIKEAAKREARTETFWTAAERSRENFLEGLKTKFDLEYKELRNLSRGPGGKFQSIKENLTWDKDRGGYVLTAAGGMFFIDVSNSPEEVNIIKVS